MIAAMNARILWIACLVTLAAVGCTADPKPNTSTVPPTPAASSSPRSSTPSVAPRPTVPADVPTTGTNLLAKGEKPPVMPASALQHTDAGAVAFAKFYLQTVDWGYATTNAAYMRHYYDKQCVGCANLDDAITRVAKNHWHYIGGRYHIRSNRLLARHSNASDVITEIRSDLDSGTAVDSKGNIHAADIAHQDFPEKIGLRWNGNDWRVVYNFGGL
jgi:hypothetical protein